MAGQSEQAARIVGPLSGPATAWSPDLWLRLGLFEHPAERPPGATADEVSAALNGTT